MDYACAKSDCGPISAMVDHFYLLDGRLENMGPDHPQRVLVTLAGGRGG